MEVADLFEFYKVRLCIIKIEFPRESYAILNVPIVKLNSESNIVKGTFSVDV